MTLEKDKNQAHYILLCSISLETVFDYNKFLFLHTVMLIYCKYCCFIHFG
jgi:hypothetical protein